jgi:hypothetical protein
LGVRGEGNGKGSPDLQNYPPKHQNEKEKRILFVTPFKKCPKRYFFGHLIFELIDIYQVEL